MGSIVKSIGKAIGKIGKSIGKLVKKALPIILMAGVAYMGIAAYGAMGSGLTGASAISPSMFTKGVGDLTAKAVGGTQSFISSFGNLFSTPTMGGTAGGAAGGMTGGSLTPFVSGSRMFSQGESTAIANIANTKALNGLDFMTGSTKRSIAGADYQASIAGAMKYQSDMMWKGNLLKAGGTFLTAMFDKSDEHKKEDQRITEEEFIRRHTYGGFRPDEGKPSDYAKPGKPGHDPTGFWGQIGGPPQYASNTTNKGGPRQFQQAGLKTPGVNQPGLINSRQGQRQVGLLGQPPKSFV